MINIIIIIIENYVEFCILYSAIALVCKGVFAYTSNVIAEEFALGIVFSSLICVKKFVDEILTSIAMHFLIFIDIHFTL